MSSGFPQNKMVEGNITSVKMPTIVSVSIFLISFYSAPTLGLNQRSIGSKRDHVEIIELGEKKSNKC